MEIVYDVSSAVGDVNQTDNMVPIEMTNKTGTNLADLNEYCLLDIFSCDYLTPADLSSLADTCKRFKQIAERVFPKQFGIISEKYLIGRETSDSKSKYFRQKSIESILKNFGFRLSTFKLDETNEDVVSLIAKYCSKVHLTRLEIHGMKSIEGVRLQLQSIFNRLLKLSVNNCDFRGTSPDITCDALIELRITESTGCGPILTKTFPNLERFIYRYDSMWSKISDDNTSIIVAFIENHRHLKTLQLIGSSIYCNSELVDAIGNSGQELEVLTLQSLMRPKISFDVPNLLSLPKLWRLDLDINFENYNQIIALLQASPVLREVKLYFEVEIPVQVFDSLAQQQHLRELILYYYSFDRIDWSMLTQLRKLVLFTLVSKFGPVDLLKIVRQLTNLEELRVDDYKGSDAFLLSERDFDRIVRIVERRSNVLTLKCRHEFKLSENCEKNRKVKLLKIN
ncbi:uncharacterized protein LOC119075441 [Bradysia coprophila]|uniref:uncharacterized protein LOC119075440 n=1 Tax=Bradysia coprophila TaxID=38358 RepID=UPI00187D7F24|nr:uncharacterized protein LOC119075440 [Bradysia coprophila]XP_037037775.1 uncharacterized protein LOC119075441 [Bradysia coprophila]